MSTVRGRRLSWDAIDAPAYLITIGIVIALLVAAGIVLMIVRRRLLAAASRPGDEGIFESLRKMRDQGDISPEEYDRARRSIVEKLAARKDRPDTPR